MDPVVSSRREVCRIPLGPGHVAKLCTDVRVPDGWIQYAHILEVVDAEGPVFFVTAEVQHDIFGGEDTLILGVFEQGGHENWGHRDRLEDLDTFQAIALEVARQILKGENS